jgi:hypothetical protein
VEIVDEDSDCGVGQRPVFVQLCEPVRAPFSLGPIDTVIDTKVMGSSGGVGSCSLMARALVFPLHYLALNLPRSLDFGVGFTPERAGCPAFIEQQVSIGVLKRFQMSKMVSCSGDRAYHSCLRP